MDYHDLFVASPLPERSVAETLRLMADSEHYRQSLERGYGMCHALHYAGRMGLITSGERRRAEEEIQRYIDYLFPDGVSYMRTSLRFAGLPHDNEALINLYSNWENKNV